MSNENPEELKGGIHWFVLLIIWAAMSGFFFNFYGQTWGLVLTFLVGVPALVVIVLVVQYVQGKLREGNWYWWKR